MWWPQYLTTAEVNKIIRDRYQEMGLDQPVGLGTPEERAKEDELIAAWEKKNPGKLWGLALAKQMDQERGEQLAREKAAKER